MKQRAPEERNTSTAFIRENLSGVVSKNLMTATVVTRPIAKDEIQGMARRAFIGEVLFFGEEVETLAFYRRALEGLIGEGQIWG